MNFNVEYSCSFIVIKRNFNKQIYTYAKRDADFALKCQRNVNFKDTVLLLTLKKSFRSRQSLRAFPVIVSNNYPRIRGEHP
jgi:hypothetical protein